MVNPNFVIEKMKDLDYRYYVVEDMAGSMTDQQWQSIPVDRAIDKFKSFLKNCSVGSSYIVFIFKTNERLKNGEPTRNNVPMRYEIFINEPYGGNPMQEKQDGEFGLNGIAESMYRAGSMGSIGLDTYIGAKDEILSLKLKIQQLEMENRYLQDKHTSEMARLEKDYEDKLSSDKKIEGIIGSVLPAMGLGGNGIAGITQEKATMEASTSKEKIINAINILVHNDANFVENITKLAELSKKNKTIYEMAVKQLNSL